jgi:formylglycine-generating enzyme required for sulfatase activity
MPHQDFWWLNTFHQNTVTNKTKPDRLKQNKSTIKPPLWYDENSGDQLNSHSQASSQWNANPFGLYDMHGNIFEWVWDGYNDNFFERSTTTDPLNHIEPTYGVIKGGSFRNRLYQCRAGHRVKINRDTKNDQIGFRIVFVPQQK